MRGRRLVAVALTLVLFAVIGLLYLQAMSQGRATRDAWVVTRDLTAGAVLDSTNTKQIRVPAAGDSFAILDQSPLTSRISHPVRVNTLLTPDDILSKQTVQVPLTIHASPSLAAGDTLDVYAVVAAHAVLVGRHIAVVSTGNPLTVLVPAGDEAYWVALQANNVSLFASKSDGVGVPNSSGVTTSDAIAGLTGSAQSGDVLTGGAR